MAAAAIALPLLASLVNFLRYRGYPLGASELWPIYLGFAGVGLAIGAIYVLSPRVVGIAIEAALVAIVVDLNTNNNDLLVAGAAMATVALGLAARMMLARVFAFGGLVLFALCVAGIGAEKPREPGPIAAGSPNRPVLLHLILDEHPSAARMFPQNPESPAWREQLNSLYVEDGFRVYGGAYSQYRSTNLAVPQIFNFGARQPVPANNRPVSLRVNAYFDQLQKRGYALRVYENGWVGLCAHSAQISCVHYDEAGFKGLYRSHLSPSDKRATVVLTFLARSSIMKRIVGAYSHRIVPPAQRLGLPLAPIVFPAGTSTLQALDTAAGLLADLARARPGQAYIAHLLLPHSPFVTRRDCSLKPLGAWVDHHRGVQADTRPLMLARQAAAYEQAQCTQRLVRAASAAIERSSAGQSYVVIIHGDHGSRITAGPLVAGKPVAASDLISGYATIFAVKGAGLEPGYVATAARVDDLLDASARSGFATAPTPVQGDGLVYLQDRQWRPAASVRLPADWAKP